MTEKERKEPDHESNYYALEGEGVEYGEISVNKFAAPSRLEEDAKKFEIESQSVIEAAKKKGKDVVIFTSQHGTAVLVGVGVAAAVTLVALGGRKIYQHRKRGK
jgi:hypothetical protein